jgi:hypothetical protein
MSSDNFRLEEKSNKSEGLSRIFSAWFSTEATLDKNASYVIILPIRNSGNQ